MELMRIWRPPAGLYLRAMLAGSCHLLSFSPPKRHSSGMRTVRKLLMASNMTSLMPLQVCILFETGIHHLLLPPLLGMPGESLLPSHGCSICLKQTLRGQAAALAACETQCFLCWHPKPGGHLLIFFRGSASATSVSSADDCYRCLMHGCTSYPLNEGQSQGDSPEFFLIPAIQKGAQRQRLYSTASELLHHLI